MSKLGVGSLQSQVRRALSLVVASAFVLLTACSGSSLERYSAQASKDEGKLLNNYRQLILPALQTNCQTCHATGKEMSSIPHSDPDTQTAWDTSNVNGLWNYTDPEHSKLVNKLKSGHHCWGTCADNAAFMVAQVNRFKAQMGDALNGFGSTDDNGGDMVTTAAVVVPASLDTNTGTDAKPNYVAKDMVFDISAESGIAGAKFIITVNRGAKQYLVTNLRVSASQPIYIRKVEVALNGVVDSSNSTFDFVEANISATSVYVPAKTNNVPNDNVGTGGTLIEGDSIMPIAWTDGPGKDKLAIQFGQIGKGITDPVPTFADIKAILLNSDYGTAGGMGCASCHATNADATLNFMTTAILGNEAAFKAAVVRSKAIINGTNPDASPLYTTTSKGASSTMPKTGTKLTPEDAEKIRRYIKGQ